MIKHLVLIVSLTFVALAAGVAMVPGDREQWTMLWRDGQNEQALRALEARYAAGGREPDTVLHLYKLYMSFSDIDQATNVIQQFAADHPADPAALALLARHYDDTQNKVAAVKTLEQLFAVAPSLPTAQSLLSYYRLEGEFNREERLLRALLADQLITANDSERLGLLLAATGDLYGARDALIRFDEIANPERILGRLALFDVLVQVGDKTEALTRGASWFGYWRKANLRHTGGGDDLPSGRLIRMMVAVDEPMARKLICEAQREEQAANEPQANTSACDTAEPGPPPSADVYPDDGRESAPRRRRR